MRARKREREVRVRFAAEDCTVQSPEGVVYARAGDALLTGSAGEHWRVSRARFDMRYRPAPGTKPWADGAYLAVPREVLALRMARPFTVILTDGRSELRGHPGDWLVDYGDGSLGVVAAAIFDSTYEIAG